MKQDKDKLMRVNIRFINALQTSHFFWDKAFRRVGHHGIKRYHIFFKKNMNEYYEDLRNNIELTYDLLKGMRSEESIWELWSVHLKFKVATRIYSGLRYRFGLPSRGQRTRSNCKTIGYLCRVKVRKNVNYSAQKKKRDDALFSVGSSKSKEGVSFKHEHSRNSEYISQTHLYDASYAEKVSFLTSISGFRNSFTSNQLVVLNKELLKNFKLNRADGLQLSGKKKHYRSRSWWLRKQKSKVRAKIIKKQRAYQRYLVRFNIKIKKMTEHQSRLKEKGLSGDSSKIEKSKLIPFDQFLMPSEKRKQQRKRKEDRLFRMVDKSLQAIKLKWIYFFFLQKLVFIQSISKINSKVNFQYSYLDVSSCLSSLEKPVTFLNWEKSLLVTTHFEQGKEKKEQIQKEKLRLNVKRTDASHGVRSSVGVKSLKRSDQARQKELALKLRKHKQRLQRSAGTKARQGFSM